MHIHPVSMSVPLSLRRLGGAQILLDVDPSTTIRSIKTILETYHSVAPASYRLVLRGRVLTDDEPISSLQIQPGDFIIILPQINSESRPVPEPAAERLSLDAASPSTADPPNFSELVVNLMDAVSLPRDLCERALRLTGFRPEAAAGFLLDPGERVPEFGGNEEELIGRLIEAIGLPREHCERALRNSGFNVELAAAMLVAGAPIESDDRKMAGKFPNDGADKFDFTDEERAQIARLQEITGRDRDYITQVFVACDKNEEATANCLFEEK
jgi:hypothetical protein